MKFIKFFPAFFLASFLVCTTAFAKIDIRFRNVSVSGSSNGDSVTLKVTGGDCQLFLRSSNGNDYYTDCLGDDVVITINREMFDSISNKGTLTWESQLSQTRLFQQDKRYFLDLKDSEVTIIDGRVSSIKSSAFSIGKISEQKE